MDKINKNPEIRFKGYKDDWCVKTAEFLCSISTGKNNTQDKIEGGKYPFYVRSLTIERSNNYLFDEEAVLTVGDGVGTGKVYHYVNGKYDLHQRVYRMFDFKELSGKYFYYYFSNNFHKRVIAMTAKSSVDSVRMDMISNMDIIYPRLVDEQNSITSFFQNLDNLITLHQRKYDKLVILKKAMLVKMFPKKGSLIPEIRFKGFTEDWVEKELRELAVISTGYPFDSKIFSEEGEYLVITNGNIQNDSSTVDNSKGNRLKSVDTLSHYLLDINDILVTMDGTVGRTAKVINNKQVLAQRVGRLKAIFDSEFLYQFLNTGDFFTEMKIKSHGGTIKHISLTEIGEYKNIVPNSEIEQQKIGSYFESLDNQIALNKTQLDKLITIKKACFSKMFVGQY